MGNPDRDHSESEAGAEADTPAGVACDFCGEVVATVRRVALDAEYDRLQKRHQIQYACPACSEKKENARLGLARS